MAGKVSRHHNKKKKVFLWVGLGAVAIVMIGVLYWNFLVRPTMPLTPKTVKFVSSQRLWGDFEVKRFRLPNGLTVLVGKVSSNPIFAYQTWFRVGSRNEEVGKTGLAHLFEHMMFKGTKRYKSGEMDRILEAKGASPNASTFVDWTYYRESMPYHRNNIELVAKLEADRMVNLLINQEQLDSERDVVLNERRFRIDNDPGGKMYEQLFYHAFTKHPYRWPVIGWAEDLEKTTVESCLDFYRIHYAPNNAIISVVGDVDENEVLYFIEQYYGPLPAQKIPEGEFVKEPRQEEERRREMTFEVQTEKVLFGYHVPDVVHADIAALTVLDAILFEGRSSRLYKRLVFEEEIATTVGSWLGYTVHPGLYEMEIDLRARKEAKLAEQILDEELEKVQSELVSERELDRAKNILEADFFRSAVSNEGKASWVGQFEVVAGAFEFINEIQKNIKRVMPEDVMRVAKAYLHKDNRTVIVMKPKRPAGEKKGKDASTGQESQI